MNIICILSFVSASTGINFWVKESVEGHILAESQYNYLVDFTKGLKEQWHPVGDYSNQIIEKNKCVKR